jgi:uncharacterized protein (DUF433 family)
MISIFNNSLHSNVKGTIRLIFKKMIYLTERLTLDEGICNGKPTIRGLRITVQTILEYLAAGDVKEDILYQYPDLEPEDIDACLKFASELVGNRFMVKQIP